MHVWKQNYDYNIILKRVIKHWMARELGVRYGCLWHLKCSLMGSGIFVFPFFFFPTPHGLQDLSSQTRDWTWVTTVKALSPNHWDTREFLGIFFILEKNSYSIRHGIWYFKQLEVGWCRGVGEMSWCYIHSRAVIGNVQGGGSLRVPTDWVSQE